MPTPTKPISLILENGNARHLTKAEIEIRDQAEKSLLTGKPMKEYKSVKEDPVAHGYFKDIRNMLEAIGKNDALIEMVINRYCLLLSECDSFAKEDERLRASLEKLEGREDEMEFTDYIKTSTQLSKLIIDNDKQLQTKRKMLLDIEKENVMTLASQLRSIPKKPEDKTKSSMAAFLKKRNGTNGI